MENSGTINLDESNFDREINTDKPVLVDCWYEWCGPCKLIAPLLDEIAREKSDAVKVSKVNVDQNQSLSFKYNIRAIPSLLFFKNFFFSSRRRHTRFDCDWSSDVCSSD